MIENYISPVKREVTVMPCRRGKKSVRWTNNVLAQRKCTLCDNLEDEYYYVVTCVKFFDLRIKYLLKHTNPSMNKFLNFVNSENKSQLRKLGLFLHHAFIKYTNDEVLN